ncbi:MAG: FadR/GntR family transcriptional regulator [Acidimicrobiales bacterium]
MSDSADALFRPLRAGNAFEDTIERIMQAIRLGVVAPGERLPPERELATRLNVSRDTLREAIRALQESGVISSRRGRSGGSFVTYSPPHQRAAEATARRLPKSDDGKELADALAFRHVLEEGAAEMAAGHPVSSPERTRLLAMLRASAEADLVSYRQADSRLHLCIAEMARSSSLLAAVADMRARINDFLDEIPLLKVNLTHANDQHAAIVEAILAGEPDASRAAMADHLDGTAALLRGFLG